MVTTHKLQNATPPATRRELYPSIEPYRSGWLRVSPLHEIYWEESGNPRGKRQRGPAAATIVAWPHHAS